MKTKQPPTPEAMLQNIKRAIAQMREGLALAAEALEASYLEDAYDIECLEREWGHRLRDVQYSVKELVRRSHGWPGAGRLYFHDLPDPIKERLGATLPQYPDRHFNDHRSELFCLAFHRRLPALHTDAWHEWKKSGEETVAACAGYREALEKRVAEAREHAAEIEQQYGCAVEITRFGDLIIPRNIDPWADLQVGALDNLHFAITHRVTYGYHPDDRAPATLVRGSEDDEDEEPSPFAPGFGMQDGRSRTHETQWCLHTMYVKEYRAPVSGERLRLEQVPHDHWYRKREGAPALKRASLKGRDENEIVIYIGDQPDPQIGLFGDASEEEEPAATVSTRPRRAARVSIPGLLAEA